MMKKLFLVLFLFCAGLSASDEVLTVFSTTDIHGKIFMQKTLPDFLKLGETLRKDRASSGGKKKTLWIDCGDLTQGSFETALDGGNLTALLLKEFGADVWVPGNHDFEFGLDKLLENARLFGKTMLCGNAVLKGKALFPGWKTFILCGKKIAVIGLTSDHIASWSWRPEESGLSIEKTPSALEKIMPQVMRSHPDLIILAIHAGRFPSKRLGAGWNMRGIASRYPQIDLILGGHTHERVPGETAAGKVWYTQAGKYAESYVKTVVTFGRKKTLRSEAVVLTGTEKGSLPAGNAGKMLQERKKSLKEKICTKAPALGWKAGPDVLRKLFCEAMMRASGAKIAFHGVLSPANKVKPVYTEKDLFDLCPFENTMILMEISKDECLEIMREQQKPKNNMFQMLCGASLKKGKIFFNDGKEWKDGRVLCAFNSFAASSAGMRFPVLKSIGYKKETKARDSGKKIRDLLRDEMKRRFN